jgi:MYXO-CTERM domain-containing protein
MRNAVVVASLVLSASSAYGAFDVAPDELPGLARLAPEPAASWFIDLDAARNAAPPADVSGLVAEDAFAASVVSIDLAVTGLDLTAFTQARDVPFAGRHIVQLLLQPGISGFVPISRTGVALNSSPDVVEGEPESLPVPAPGVAVLSLGLLFRGRRRRA